MFGQTCKFYRIRRNSTNHMSADSTPTIHFLLVELIGLLRQRLAVIKDHEWRDRDPHSHLEGLRQASEKISAWTLTNRTEVDSQLRHYLGNSSFHKALAHAEALTGTSPTL